MQEIKEPVYKLKPNIIKESTIEQLFELICEKRNNEDEIITILRNEDLRPMMHQIVNFHENDYDETMLMWAVWRLKPNVIKELVEQGADVNYHTSSGESAATYWDLNDSDRNDNGKQWTAAEIAEYLHKLGLNLSIGSNASWSLVKSSHKKNLGLLKERLTRLGYRYTDESDEDDWEDDM